MSDLNGGMAAGYALKELLARPGAAETDGTGLNLLPMQTAVAEMKEQFAYSADAQPGPITTRTGWRTYVAAALRRLAAQLEPERVYAPQPEWSSGTR